MPTTDGEKDPENCDELKDAIGRTKDEEAGRQQYLIRKAIDLGCVEHIPDHWSIDVE